MINIQKTLLENNINIEDLKPESCKMVWWNCDLCNLEKLKIYRYAKKQHICLKCSNSINAKKSAKKRSDALKLGYKTGRLVHAMLNRKHSEEAKKKISIKATNRPCPIETKIKLSKKNTGKGNPFYGKKHSKESLEKMSEMSRKNVRKGKQSNFYGKKYWKKNVFIYNEIKFKSNWEKMVAIYFDKNKIKWEYEPKYFDLIREDGIEMSYTPDFYLSDYDKYIEVKGYWYKDAKEKFDLFVKQYSKISIDVFDEKVLKEKNII